MQAIGVISAALVVKGAWQYTDYSEANYALLRVLLERVGNAKAAASPTDHRGSAGLISDRASLAKLGTRVSLRHHPRYQLRPDPLEAASRPDDDATNDQRVRGWESDSSDSTYLPTPDSDDDASSRSSASSRISTESGESSGSGCDPPPAAVYPGSRGDEADNDDTNAQRHTRDEDSELPVRSAGDPTVTADVDDSDGDVVRARSPSGAGGSDGSDSAHSTVRTPNAKRRQGCQ